jgi:hypothetical protein
MDAQRCTAWGLNKRVPPLVRDRKALLILKIFHPILTVITTQNLPLAVKILAKE